MRSHINWLVVILAFLATPVVAHDSEVDINKLYKHALESFENKEYVECLKKFVMFKAYGEEYLKNNPAIALGVDERVVICENKVIQAVKQYKSQLNELTFPINLGQDVFNGSNAPGSFGGFRGNGRVEVGP